MEKKTNIPLWLTILMIVLLAYSIVDGVIALVNLMSAGASMEIISMVVLALCAALCAVAYCLMGSGKKAAELFHFFCVMYMLDFLFACLSRAITDNGLYMLPALLSFGLTLTYTLGENFGKRKSYFIAIIVLVCAIADLITVLAMQGATGLIPTNFIGRCIQAAAFCVLVIAKYLDKAARGTT